MNTKLLKVSLAGVLISAVCCFTPLLVWVLTALGMGAAIVKLDSILIPTLVFFAGLTLYALITKRQ